MGNGSRCNAVGEKRTVDRDGDGQGKQNPDRTTTLFGAGRCEKDLPAVLEKVAKMGYAGVEFAGYHGRSAKELRELMDQNGLKCCGTHIQLGVIQGDELGKTVEFNRVLGNPYLIVSGMPHTYTDSIETVKRVAGVYNQAAAKIKDQGMYVGYHADEFDFKKIGDETAWDLFFEHTDKNVTMQMDTANCIVGGGDLIASLKRFPGRSLTIHLKDTTGGPSEALVGEGDVNWEEVFRVCETTAGTRWYVVEHDRPMDTAMEDAERCLKNLKAMGK